MGSADRLVDSIPVSPCVTRGAGDSSQMNEEPTTVSRGVGLARSWQPTVVFMREDASYNCLCTRYLVSAILSAHPPSFWKCGVIILIEPVHCGDQVTVSGSASTSDYMTARPRRP